MLDMKEAARRLQKDGEYRFEGLGREESRRAAATLARAAMKEDRKNGIQSSFGIARDAFGYYCCCSLGLSQTYSHTLSQILFEKWVWKYQKYIFNRLATLLCVFRLRLTN